MEIEANFFKGHEMRKTYRSKKFRENICIKYTDLDGGPAVFEINQQLLTDIIKSKVKRFTLEGYTLTGRQLFYQLVKDNAVPNAEKVYKRILSLLVDLRYNGVIDWDAIEDRARESSRPSQWKHISGLIDSALYAYRLPRWKDQDYYLELYCEKQALEGILKPVADKYHIYYGSNKGYSSASAMYRIAKRMDDKIYANKICKLIYLGDHDPSGLDMVRDIQERICEFLGLEVENNEFFNVIPVALNKEQIEIYSPPPNPARFEDPRAKWYIKEFGNVSWELDALEPSVLVDVAEGAILEYLDMDKYNGWIKREKKDAIKLREFNKGPEE